jgi:hypothetical protein
MERQRARRGSVRNLRPAAQRTDARLLALPDAPDRQG